jgi:hypothetical protein
MIPPVPSAKSPATTPRLGYANVVERWDAHKNKAGSPSPSSPRPASSSPGCASSCDSWNTNKKSPSICNGGMANGRSHCCSWHGTGDNTAVMPSLVDLSPYPLDRWCRHVTVGKTRHRTLPCYIYSDTEKSFCLWTPLKRWSSSITNGHMARGHNDKERMHKEAVGSDAVEAWERGPADVQGGGRR